MVSVYTVFELAVLAVEAGIQAAEEGDGIEFVLGGLVIVFEAAVNALGTGPAEVVVIA